MFYNKLPPRSCIMFLMRADTLRGQVGGDWALEMESFLGPVKWHPPIGECHLGPKKLGISRAQSPPTCAENRSQSSHFSQHSVYVPIKFRRFVIFSPFLRIQLFFSVRYSSCFSFPSPSEDVYKGTGITFTVIFCLTEVHFCM
jgi:hypothetical protein